MEMKSKLRPFDTLIASSMKGDASMKRTSENCTSQRQRANSDYLQAQRALAR